MRETEGLEAWFGLVGMIIKPLASPEGEGETRVLVRGWPWNNKDNGAETKMNMDNREENKDALDWFVDFPSEYHLPLNATMSKSWRKLKRVEIWAEYGVDRLDWEFCIAELVIELTPIAKQDMWTGKGEHRDTSSFGQHLQEQVIWKNMYM